MSCWLFRINKLVDLRLLRQVFVLSHWTTSTFPCIASCSSISYIWNFSMWLLVLLSLRKWLSSSLLVLTLQISSCSSWIMIVMLVFQNHELLVASSSLTIIMSCISCTWKYLSINSRASLKAPLVVQICWLVVTAINRSNRISSLQNDRGCSSTTVWLVMVFLNSRSWVSLLRHDTSRCMSESGHAIVSVLPLVIVVAWWSLAVTSFLLYNNLLVTSSILLRHPSSATTRVIVVLTLDPSYLLFRLVGSEFWTN